MTTGAGGEPPHPEPAKSFRGWQRGACLIGVGLLFVFMLLLTVVVGLGTLGVG
ncbi:MAG: hypothetical protein ACREOA_09135 [Candidatus Dormibacteria bacterium]